MIGNEDIDRMTPQEVVAYLTGDAPLNRARRVFYDQMQAIIQSHANGRVNIINQRRMELKAVIAIARALEDK